MKKEFLQTGVNQGDVYVIPSAESAERGNKMWLLFAAAYGLINVKEKWKIPSDVMLLDLGFTRAALMPQLLLLLNDAGRLSAILA